MKFLKPIFNNVPEVKKYPVNISKANRRRINQNVYKSQQKNTISDRLANN